DDKSLEELEIAIRKLGGAKGLRPALVVRGVVALGALSSIVLLLVHPRPKAPKVKFTHSEIRLMHLGPKIDLSSFLIVKTNAQSGTGAFTGTGVDAAGLFDPAHTNIFLSDATRRINLIRFAFTNAHHLSAIQEIAVVVFKLPEVGFTEGLIQLPADGRVLDL